MTAIWNSQDKETKQIISIMEKYGFEPGYNLTADGIWGAKTTTAVNKFRKKCGWKENGKLGKNAMKVLIA